MISVQAKDSPLYARTRIIEIPDAEAVAHALQRDATARRILAKNIPLHDGMYCGTRLNLNVLRSTGIAVNTVHAPTNKVGYKHNKGWYNGAAMSYQAVVVLRNAFCNVQQVARDRIATGVAKKSPIASVDGELDLTGPIRLDGVELRFNPARERLFVDLNGHPVHFVEHATVVGHRVYARGTIRYYEHVDEAPAKVGNAPCAVIFPSSTTPHQKTA